MQNQRGFVGVGVLIAIVLGLIVVGGGTYFVMQQKSISQTTSDISDTEIPTNVQTSVEAKTQTSQNKADASYSKLGPLSNASPATDTLHLNGSVIQLSDSVAPAITIEHRYGTNGPTWAGYSKDNRWAMSAYGYGKARITPVDLGQGWFVNFFRLHDNQSGASQEYAGLFSWGGNGSMQFHSAAKVCDCDSPITLTQTPTNGKIILEITGKENSTITLERNGEKLTPATENQTVSNPAPNSSPSLNTGIIKITSPNGGEIFSICQTYPVQWEGGPSGSTYAYMNTLKSTGVENMVVEDIARSNLKRQDTWTLGNAAGCNGGGTIAPGEYKIRIKVPKIQCIPKEWVGVGEGDPNARQCSSDEMLVAESGWFTVVQ